MDAALFWFGVVMGFMLVAFGANAVLKMMDGHIEDRNE